MEEIKNSFMSEKIDQISAALSLFQGEIEQPKLNKENPYFKSRYVDLSGVLNATQKILSKNGLSISQIINGDNLITILFHKSGQWIKSDCPIGQYKSQQDRGSALTYTKRYAYCAILGIAADSDYDGNLEDGNTAESKEPKKSTSAIAFTGEQLKQALAELESAKTNEEYQAVWIKWSNAVPAICKTGTEFYKACEQKYAQLQ